MWKKEEYIETEIHSWFISHWIFSWSNLMRWFYDEKAWKYRGNKNPFHKNWISDVSAIIDSTFVCIEVKKSEEMSFFDRDIQDLRKRLAEAQFKWVWKTTLKKYLHAVEQREFLDNIIKWGGIWFFSSSLKQTVERLEQNWFIIS